MSAVLGYCVSAFFTVFVPAMLFNLLAAKVGYGHRRVAGFWLAFGVFSGRYGGHFETADTAAIFSGVGGILALGLLWFLWFKLPEEIDAANG